MLEISLSKFFCEYENSVNQVIIISLFLQFYPISFVIESVPQSKIFEAINGQRKFNGFNFV